MNKTVSGSTMLWLAKHGALVKRTCGPPVEPRRTEFDAVGVTIYTVRRQAYVIAVPFLLVCWVLIAWKAGLFTPRSG
jgi:hypothetical protein